MTLFGHRKTKSSDDNARPTTAVPLGWRYAGPQPATYSIVRPNRNSVQFHRAPDDTDNFKKVSISRKTLNKWADDIDSEFNLSEATVPALQTMCVTPDPLTVDTTSPLRGGATVRTTTRRRRLYTVPPHAAGPAPVKRGESVPPRTSSRPPVTVAPAVSKIASSSKVPDMIPLRPAPRPHGRRAVTSAGAIPTQPIPEGSEEVPLMLDTSVGNGRSSLESIAEAAEQQRRDEQRRSERHLENKRRYKKMQMENHNLWVLLDAKTRQVDYMMQAMQADGKYDQALASGLDNQDDVRSSIEHLREVNSQLPGHEAARPAERNDETLTRHISVRDTGTANLAELKHQLQQLLNHVESNDLSPPPYGLDGSPHQYYSAELEGSIPIRYSSDEKDTNNESGAETSSEAAVDTLCPAPLRHHPGCGDVQLVEKLENHVEQEQAEAEDQHGNGQQMVSRFFSSDDEEQESERPLTMLRVKNVSPRSATSRYSMQLSPQQEPAVSARYDTPKSAIVRSYLEMAPTQSSVANALRTPTPPPTPPPKSQKRLVSASAIHPALRAPSLDSDHGSDSSGASPPATPPYVARSPVIVTIAGGDGEVEKKRSKGDDIKTTIIDRRKRRHDSEPLHWLALESPI